MDNTAVTWAVSHISPTVKFVPGTTSPVDGFDVTWTTNSGLSGDVFVPKAQINDLDAVSRAISGQIAAVVAIHSLSGEYST